MGRSENTKKTTKVSKVSKFERKNIKPHPKKSQKSTDSQSYKSKQKAEQIEPIDLQENYVLPSNFEINPDDLLLFEQLNTLKNTPNSLEKNLKAHQSEISKSSPAKDPEVLAVYQKCPH